MRAALSSQGLTPPKALAALTQQAPAAAAVWRARAGSCRTERRQKAGHGRVAAAPVEITAR